MSLFGAEPPEDDCWLVEHDSTGITVYGLTPKRTLHVVRVPASNESSMAKAVLECTRLWLPEDAPGLTWRHNRIHVQSTWEVRLCRVPDGQQYLIALALAQASRKITITLYFTRTTAVLSACYWRLPALRATSPWPCDPSLAVWH
jgi:hypothetical protein